MAKIIEILSETLTERSATTFLLASFNGEPVRFKIYTENDNAYCHLKVYIQTKNYNFDCVAYDNEIPGFTYTQYYLDKEKRIVGNTMNIQAGLEFIKNVF